MTHGSLFSGIGGFDLAAAWAGIPTLWQVEKDEYCRSVLAKHFPKVERYEDIKKVHGPYAHDNFRAEQEKRIRTCCLPTVDIVSGGFPCQPTSKANAHRRRGAADERWLWPEMLRIICEIRPTYVIAENPIGIEMEIESVCSSLENAGYYNAVINKQKRIIPVNIPASATGKTHRRDRYWFVAFADTTSKRLHRGQTKENEHLPMYEEARENKEAYIFIKGYGRTYFSIPNSVRVGNGIPRELDESRIRALGNAIVPQVAYQIFKAIKEISQGGLNECQQP